MLERVLRKRNPPVCRNANWCSHYGNSMEIPLNTKNRATIWSNNPTPGHMSGENYNLKRYMHPMFIAALFTVAKTWKQPKCPSTEEWIKKMWYIYTMEYYSAIKNNEIMPFAATQMDLEIIVILSEVSQTEKYKYHYITYMWNLKKKCYRWTYLQNRNRLTDIENKFKVTKGESGGGIN